MEIFTVIGYLIVQITLGLIFLWFPAMLWFQSRFGSVTRGEALFCLGWILFFGYVNYTLMSVSPITVSVGVG